MGRCPYPWWKRLLVMVSIVLVFPCIAAGERRPVVILDPGHGGADAGVKGAYGSLEKEISLAVALELRHQLGPLFDVRLTRESDRAVGLTGRVEMANSARGELLLSLHMGGGLSREGNGMSVLVQQSGSGPQGGAGEHWDSGHMPYLAASQDMATDLKRSLAVLEGYDGVAISRVPLAISRGARMPVVLVELGNLVNPDQENRMGDTRHLRRVASALAAAIEGYFSRNVR